MVTAVLRASTVRFLVPGIILGLLLPCLGQQQRDQDAFLVFANHRDIRLIELGSEAQSILIPGQTKAEAVDFDADTGFIFWTDVEKGNIQRAPVNNSGNIEVVVENVESGEGLAVDWINKKLYWTDAGADVIEAADFDGGQRLALITTGLKKPRAIAVHPNNGYMYWSDWGNPAKIEKCAMNGDSASRQVVVDRKIVWPNGLTIDYKEERLWWVDARRRRVESTDLNGGDRKEFFRSSGVRGTFGITVFQDWLYLTTRSRGGRVLKINKDGFGGNRIVTIATRLKSPRGIVVYHQTRQPGERDALLCKEQTCLNGGTCVETANRLPTCSCPPGFNGTRCEVTIPTILPVFTTISPTPPHKKCEPLTIPMCQGLQYNTTIFPNLLNHTTQSEATIWLYQLKRLVQGGCSDDIALFLCSVFAPPCSVLQTPVPPCRSLCNSARNGCEGSMNELGFSWPENLNCNRFPNSDEGICIGGNTTSISPTPPQKKCEPLTIPMCQGLQYNTTIFPNMMNHKTQDEAASQLQYIAPLIQLGCSDDLALFMCTMHAPPCSDSQTPVLPCRSLCNSVKHGCHGLMKKFGVPWPDNMCDPYPESGQGVCIGSNTTSISPTPPQQKCEPLTIPTCQGLQYNITLFPNMMNHTTQDEAALELNQLSPLVQSGCSDDLSFFLCSVYAPVCTVLHTPVPPCRSLCYSVKNGCKGLLKRFGIPWPDSLSCNRFPESGQGVCIGSNTTSISPTPPQKKCEPLTIPMCQGLQYNTTIFPNMMNHKTQDEAASQLQYITPLIQLGCSDDLALFMCTMHAPPCSDTQTPVLPCRSLCNSVKRGCQGLMKKFGVPWPDNMCDPYPESGQGFCIGSNTTSISPTPPQQKCEPLTIPMCQGLQYNSTIFPNMMNHKTQDEAASQLQHIAPLIQLGCSDDLALFMCTMYAPPCSDSQTPVLPCRSLCYSVKRGCQGLMKKFGIPWPDNMCDPYPESGQGVCIGGNTTSISPTPPQKKCEPLTIPMCQGLQYNTTIFPNMMNHKTQDEAASQLQYIAPLIQLGCSDDLALFMCTMHAPPCSDSQTPVLPCRSLCNSVKRGCQGLMKKFGVPWPDNMCDPYPESGQGVCIGGNTTSISPTPPQQKCEPLTIPMCQGLQYNTTVFPTMLHETQDEAALPLQYIRPLIKAGCSDDLALFMCTMYAPPCSDSQTPVFPCRSLCNSVKRGCQGLMRKFGVPWPDNMCDPYPESGQGVCIGSNTTSISPTPPQQKCEPLTIPMCQGLQYNTTIFPNMLNHTTQDEAALEVYQFFPLVKLGCSDDLALFLCSVYAPPCSVLQTSVPPCRSLCRSVKKGCKGWLKRFGIPWPENLNCGRFPKNDEDICIGSSRTNETTQQPPITTSGKCGSNEFECDTGACINKTWVCDGESDCADSSDEVNCNVTQSCNSGEFLCIDKSRCISRSWMCDGENDCLDRSDEVNCNATQSCNSSQFQCRDTSQCIPRAWMCDGDYDCTDSSDEENCNVTQSCNSSQFQCRDTSQCIPRAWMCDGDFDCSDRSDEANCNVTQSCNSSQFQCNDKSRCFPIRYMCDGDYDCTDRSDEANCNVTQSCNSGEFLCIEKSRCIPRSYICDGDNDCADRSDEANCNVTQSCSNDQFQCRDTKRCILNAWICDGYDDCGDNSDETNCNKTQTCDADQFKCNTTGKCIPSKWACDGQSDCSDSSDEFNCTAIECEHGKFKCKTVQGDCIAPQWVCDGQDDCGDNSDEFNCTAPMCKDNEFLCNQSKKCIPANWKCDGDQDCPDDSDEAGCSNLSKCRNKEFQCEDGACVHVSWRCDGEADCEDSSDELNCNSTASPSPLPCNSGDFQCGTGECVAKKKRCDGKVDCPDRSDEKGCGGRPCGANHYMCGNGKCIDFEARCNWITDCSDGSDEMDCEIERCQVHGGCSQGCSFHEGVYTCKCAEGYELTSDNKTCRALGDKGFILILTRFDIRRLQLNALRPKLVVSKQKSAVGLDFHFKSGHVYWSDVFTDTIQRAPVKNGADVEVVIKKDLDSPDDLAVDWINSKLYWIDKHRIEVADLDGGKRLVLIQKGLVKPRAIALHPLLGYMFWTDWSDDAKIEKCGMNGDLDSRRVIINENIGWPNGLTIDYVLNRIWWTDARRDIIESADLNGNHRRVVLKSGALSHPFGISVFLDNMYWTDWSARQLFRANKFTGDKIVVSKDSLPSVMNVVVFHQQRQPSGPNPCNVTAESGGCSHICLLAPVDLYPEGFSCHCYTNQFHCSYARKCIPDKFVCDGKDDCGDYEDESNCTRPSTPSPTPSQCDTHEFQCGDGKCIWASFRCDGDSDCTDNSDEWNCTTPSPSPIFKCDSGKFQCGDGRCIPALWRCDGDSDCSDNSDEFNCTTPSRCDSRSFQCEEGQCILARWRCDGDSDCSDNSDELNCTTANSTSSQCNSNEFQCEDGQCILARWRCDGDSDCSDNSDELNCTTANSTSSQCNSNEFQCEDGQCIPARWRCDGDSDCSDNSDELNCTTANSTSSQCNSNEFQCEDGQCILARWRCDGDSDCSDNSDELNCTTANSTSSQCNSDEFQCEDGQCIPARWLCDGDSDCADNSDERNCNSSSRCDSRLFQCDDGSCIDTSWKCDGEADCDDKSDEWNCTTPSPSPLSPSRCNSTEFQCGTGECVEEVKRCDGKQDCPDESDEQACDEDRCQTHGGCSQGCSFNEGVYTCECAEGYELISDNKTCRALGDEGFILISTRYDIRRLPLNTANLQLVVSNQKAAVGLDFDFEAGNVYWSDLSSDIIQRAPVKNGSNAEVIVKKDLRVVEGLAVDWINKKLYWTDAGTPTIEVADLDGENRLVLIQTGLANPRAIAVHPFLGYMFWTEWGDQAKIEKCGMNGDLDSRRVIINVNDAWLNGLTIDYTLNRIWWTDARRDIIESADLNGNHRRVILTSASLSHPFGISVFLDNMYWTDWGDGQLFRANKFTGEEKVAITAPMNGIMNVVVSHRQRQPLGPNRCNVTSASVGCSHICLLAPVDLYPKGFSCRCPFGMLLLGDLRTCSWPRSP